MKAIRKLTATKAPKMTEAKRAELARQYSAARR
jgi:hypothetical protein